MSKLSNIQSKLPAWMKSDVFIAIVTFLLWILFAVFSFYVMLEFQHMILRRYAASFPDSRWNFQVVRQWSTIFFIAIWLGFVIIMGEYQYQHIGQAVTWKVFRRSLIVLLIILALSLIL